MNAILDSALRCVQLGWFVFALAEKSKQPDSEFSPNGFNSSTNDPDKVRDIWTKKPNANIGIDLGRSNLTVLDFDNGAPPADLDLPNTLQVKTGRGTHVYFTGISKQGKLFHNGQPVGDIKSAGGYVLGPNSIHPDGPTYAIVNRTPVVAVPDIDRLRAPKTPVDASLKGAKIPHGQHDNTLRDIARKLRGQGLEEDGIFDMLVEIVEKRCEGYGSDYLDMCRKHAKTVVDKFEPNPVGTWLTVGGQEQAQPQAAPQTADQLEAMFAGVGELETGDIRMMVEGIIPEGVTFIGALPGEGKSWVALSLVRALTTGEPFLGHFEVPKINPVLYLAAEAGARSFRSRADKLGLPHDRNRLLVRTLSQGAILNLKDPAIVHIVSKMKAVVVIDTMVRFSESDDENSATQNKGFVNDVLGLIVAGAPAVIVIHHATKAARKEGISLETVLRGSGDIAASADAVWGLRRDENAYKGGLGPNEVEMTCVKPRDFEPAQPFRIAFTKQDPNKSLGIGGCKSVLDTNGDFEVVIEASSMHAAKTIDSLITADRKMTIMELAEATKQSTWVVRSLARDLGWKKPNTRGAWIKAASEPVPVSPPQKATTEDVSIGF